MFETLKAFEERYEELTKLLSDPQIIAQQDKFRSYAKSHAELSEMVETYRKYQKVLQEIEETWELIKSEKDKDMREMAEGELKNLELKREDLEGQLKILMLPKDPNDEKNIFLEIRAGTGGDEASLFAAELFRMYTKYAESKNWRVEIMSQSISEVGGFKEIIASIEGKGAYSRLKFESGVHRVQRVPVTEGSGRIHTSTSTVAVLPEADEVEVEIDPNDIRIDVFRSSGPGGQSVNTTDSAVRVTHIPTGIVISCQDEKSQHKNKAKALRVLRARLLDKAQQEQQNKISQSRKSQIGSGDRSERIRTYNFPQSRITDHRINFTTHNMSGILNGDLDEIVDPLIAYTQAEQLKSIA
jgi:peptide chain release factor 1